VNQQASLLNHEFSLALRTELSLRWVSPLRVDKYREYHDSAFMNALGLPNYNKQLCDFWPSRGPVWDALAVDETTGGILLLEAKSHVPEIRGGGCKAKARSSIQKIDTSIAKTKEWLNAPETADWKGTLYQSANRIAHLYFFRQVLQIPAWLVNIYFIDDLHSPTTRQEWDAGIREVKRQLGLQAIPFSADIFFAATLIED
jgi:hypothetical protein